MGYDTAMKAGTFTMNRAALAGMVLLGLASCATGRPDAPKARDLVARRAESLAVEEGRLAARMPLQGLKARVVPASKREAATVSAAWFGFDPEDATAALQAAIDSGASMVIVPDMGEPWVLSTTIVLRGDLELVFQPGVEVLAAKGAFRGPGEALFSANNVERLRIYGYGASWSMRGEDYRRPPYEASQWRHSLSLRGVSDAIVAGLRLENSGGDGVYVGSSPGRPDCLARPCENLVLEDLEILRHHRQGISVTAARNLTILRCLIRGTRGTAPSAGLDFEPNSRDPGFSKVLVKECLIEDNAGPALLVALGRFSEKAPSVGLRVEKSRLSGLPFAFYLSGAATRGRGTIEFSSCSWTGLRSTWPKGALKIEMNP